MQRVIVAALIGLHALAPSAARAADPKPPAELPMPAEVKVTNVQGSAAASFAAYFQGTAPDFLVDSVVVGRRSRYTFTMSGRRENGIDRAPDGKRSANFGHDKALRIWSIPNGEKPAEFSAIKEYLGALDFSADGKYLVGGEGYRGAVPCAVHVWNLETKTLVRSYRGHKGSILSVDFSADGRTIMSASTDLSIRLWDAP